VEKILKVAITNNKKCYSNFSCFDCVEMYLFHGSDARHVLPGCMSDIQMQDVISRYA